MSSDYPWGLPDLNTKEADTVMRDNDHFRITLQLCLACWKMGIPFLAIHPEAPQSQSTASTWKLKETMTLTRMDHVNTTTLDLCTMGKHLQQPTTILHGHMPQLHYDLTAHGIHGRCPYPHLYHSRRTHTNDDRNWPTRLCRTLAINLVHTIHNHWPHPTHHDTDGVINHSHGTLDDDSQFDHLHRPLDNYIDTSIDMEGHHHT